MLQVEEMRVFPKVSGKKKRLILLHFSLVLSWFHERRPTRLASHMIYPSPGLRGPSHPPQKEISRAHFWEQK